jgi:hypothetical protein
MWETLGQLARRDHAPQSLRGRGQLPETAAARQTVEEAIEKEAAASQPFSASAKGPHAGLLDARHDKTKGGRAVGRLTEAPAKAGIGDLMFGAPQGRRAQISPSAKADLKALTESMDTSYAEERKSMHQAARQVRADQGDAAMPMPEMTPEFNALRTPFFNSYWSREIQNPNPTRRAKHAKKVGFDQSAEPEIPLDQRSPDRPFEMRKARERAEKQERRAHLAADTEALRTNMPEAWAGMEAAGELVHERERKLGDPDPASPSVKPAAPVEEDKQSAPRQATVPRAPDPQQPPGAGPVMQQLVGGQWQAMPEEEKGGGPVRQARQAAIPGMQDSRAQASDPQVPSSATRPEFLDTSAGGLRRDERLMDPRELALMTNSANAQRTAQQLPAIQDAVKRAQGAETKDAATIAWHEVDRLQRGVVNRRWSGYRPSDPASVRAADARTASRRDLLGERMLDVSTTHEGLDLPSAQMPDRRLELGGDEQVRIPHFEMPGDDFDMFKNRDEQAALGHDILDNPADYLPEGSGERSRDDIRKQLAQTYKAEPGRRKQHQRMFLDRQREAAQGIDFSQKRVLDGGGALTGEAQAKTGPITVDKHPVYPEYQPKDSNPEEHFGGRWRRMDTDQAVQTAAVLGGNIERQYQELAFPAIPEDQVLQVPAAGWDAKPKKPGLFGLFAGSKKKVAYQQAKDARADVVAQAFRSMGQDRPPKYVRESEFGRDEWMRLRAERRARQDALRMRMHAPNTHMGNMIFGVMPDPKKRGQR